MKNFEYAAPRSEADVLQLLSDEPGHTEVLAGGTDLVGLLKKMVVTPDRVVNIMEVEAYRGIEPLTEGGLVVGAATTLDQVLASPHMADYRAVTDAILGINSMQLQAQGTLGGELCQRPQCWYFRSQGQLLDGEVIERGDHRFHAILGNRGPAKFVSSSRLAPALIALQAQVRIAGPESDNEQWIPVESLYRTPRHDGQRETVLQPNQLVTHILLPPTTGRGATYEVRSSLGPDFPLAAAAAQLILKGNLVRDAHLVLGQVAPVPWVARDAARSLIGLAVTPQTAESVARLALAGATPLPRNGYKVELARVAAKRAILLAAGIETGGF